MRKLISFLLISIFLFLIPPLLLAWPISAQEPPKGPEPTPNLQPSNLQPATSHLPTFQLSNLQPSNLQPANLLTKIEPQLLKKLLESGSAPFIVYLKATTDPSAAVAMAAQAAGLQAMADPVMRRTAIVEALQQTARNNQAGVLQTLSTPAGLSGQAASDIRPLWIINAVAATGNLEMVLALAARPDVEVVRLDKEVRLSYPFLYSEGAGERGSRGEQENVNLPHSPAPLLPYPLINLQSPAEWGISKIRADLVHQALGLTGAGVVVANIDTGVDWQHPALQSHYRGYTGPGHLPLHPGNWFDATGEGAAYPVDGNGHGSHTMGTMIGDGGIGVAPGAQWIAVRAFNSQGAALNSWVHSAFQWTLAPNGNPALAPDVVNNSWGSSIGADTEFQADVQALLSAGIYPVFSAGNDGPEAGTVSSPGSLNIAFAVGATDLHDEVALFSSRGPSPWGRLKPEVVAPGKEIRSSLPGGAYGVLNGTSMAAPHASGLAALLLQASPGLANNLSGLSYAITSTATPLGSPYPNNNYGWGRLDAYNAIMSVGPFGALQGVVTGSGSGTPIGHATLRITPHGGGPAINTTTGADGAYRQGLAAATYDVSVSAFGYQPVSAFGLTIVTGTATIQDFSLTPLPVGTLTGVVRDKATLQPLIATIQVNNTPVSATTNGAGVYNLSLPVGVYTVTAIAAAHRISQVVNLAINDSLITTQDFNLDSAPRILLVDSGRWYQESEIGYYQQALTDLFYPYDTWSVTTPAAAPVSSTLKAYNIVIWSSPLDSPGYIGANAALVGFLQAGGKLLLSGQDVAYYDGGGSFFGSASYFYNHLKAAYLQDNSNIFTVTGVTDGPLSGLALTLNGGDGANNQVSPDVITITNRDFAGPLLTYGAGAGLAGHQVGQCLPYRAVFLPFGFEAINSRADRSQTLSRVINWLTQPPTATGVELTPPQATLIGNFGQTVSHTVRVRNTGANTDTFTLSLNSIGPYNWPVNPLPPAALTLPACQTQTITLGVRVDVNNTWFVSDTLTLAAKSANNAAFSSLVTRTTQSPAPLLLVDDDRWYSFAAEFKAALEANQISYDYWSVPKSWAGPEAPSPPTDTLKMYPMTVWYTAYDWFQPLTTAEENRLAAYLDSGGRLMLSGQDYLYNLPNHRPSPFAQTYLGVLAHTEDYSSTQVTGQVGNLVGAGLGPYSLTFPPGYTNWTDALTPTASAQVATRGQAGQPNSLTHWGIGPGGQNWHTHFLAFGPELLAEGERTRLMQRSLGWLSWLGRSMVTPSVAASLGGEDVIYTATLINDGWLDLPGVVFTATFPAQLTPIAYSPDLNLSGGNLGWAGPLVRNTPKVLTYTANIAAGLPLGSKISQVSWLAYPQHHILVDRVAEVRVNFPDLETSALTVNPTQGVEPGDVLTYTLVLSNTGLVDDPGVTSTTTLPPMLELRGVDPPGGGGLEIGARGFTWTTALAMNVPATLTYRAVISFKTSGIIENTVYVNDGLNDPLALTARTTFKVPPIYLPIIFKSWPIYLPIIFKQAD